MAYVVFRGATRKFEVGQENCTEDEIAVCLGSVS